MDHKNYNSFIEIITFLKNIYNNNYLKKENIKVDLLVNKFNLLADNISKQNQQNINSKKEINLITKK